MRGRRGKLRDSLAWHLEWGHRVKWLQEIAEEEGVTPLALLARPMLPAELVFAWQAFWDLYGDRQFGFGCLGPIQWTALDRYAQRFGIAAPDDFERLQARVRVLDDAFREAMKPDG